MSWEKPLPEGISKILRDEKGNDDFAWADRQVCFSLLALLQSCRSRPGGQAEVLQSLHL